MTDEQDFFALEELEQDLKNIEAFLKKEEPKAESFNKEPEVELFAEHTPAPEPAPAVEVTPEAPKKKSKVKPKAGVVKEKALVPEPAKAEKKASTPAQPLYGAAKVKAKFLKH